MRKIILTFGSISGVVIIGSIVLGGLLAESIKFSQLLGYLVMIVALSVIFVGIKRYRDRELGGFFIREHFSDCTHNARRSESIAAHDNWF